MIIFGHYSTVYKRFTAGELGISEEGARGIEFQVRQRHAHIFWIPIFPIGKAYAFVRPGDSNKYEMPEDIKQLIKQQQAVGTPWYSFSLFIVIALVGLFIFTNSYFSKIKRQNNQYEQLVTNEMMAKYPTTGDYYKFKVGEGYRKGHVILKIIDYDDTMVEIAAAHDDVFTKDHYSYSIEEEIKQQKNYIHHTTSVSKEKFQSMFKDLNHSNSINFEGEQLRFQEMVREEI